MIRMIAKNRIVLFLLPALLVVATVFAAPGDDKPAQPSREKQTPKCPVMDEPIDFSAMLSTKDGPVYFCCRECIKKYKAEPDKYAKAVADQRKVLAGMPKVQVTCPVSEEPVDQEVFIEKEGQKVYFCCKHCEAKYEKEPAKYAASLASSYTYQTVCPVMEEEINPKVFTTLYNGMKLYYCCAKCDRKFREDPAKYVANLASQGVHIDPKKVMAETK